MNTQMEPKGFRTPSQALLCLWEGSKGNWSPQRPPSNLLQAFSTAGSCREHLLSA